MEVNTINERLQMSRHVISETFVEIVEGDIIVPDIKPDILKISKVDGNAFVSKKDVQDGHLRIDGIIDTYVLYIADNETNQIKGINTVLNFSENLDMPELQASMIVSVKPVITNIEYKIINARKVSVKYTIDLLVLILENKQLDVIKDIENSDCIQKQIETICFDELVAHGFENVSIKENISIPNSNLPIAEIIKVSATIEEEDYKVSYNKLLAKCELKLCVVYIADTEREEIESFETRIPVTGFIDLNGINDQMSFDVDYAISYLYLKPIYQDLKSTSISVEAEIEVNAAAYNTRSVDVISDLYNPEYEIKFTLESNAVIQRKKIATQNMKIEQMITLPELINAKVLDIATTPIITEKKLLDDKLTLNGNIELNILLYNSEKNNLETTKLELPFKETIKLNCKLSEDSINIVISTNFIKYTLESSGQLQLEAEYVIDVFEIRNVAFNTITNVTQTEEAMTPIASIVIYYVKPGDTLWKIAKEYRSTVECIMQANDLNDDKIYPGQQLLIPKKVYRVCLDSIN